MGFCRSLVTGMILGSLCGFCVLYSTASSQDISQCIQADCNDDGIQDIDDVICFYNYLLAGGPPCQECESITIGQSYIIADTSQHDYRYQYYGDSCFAYSYFHVKIDSVKFLSKTQFRIWNIGVENFTDTTFIGLTDFYQSVDTTIIDTMGIQ